MGNQNKLIFIPMRLKNILNESDLKGYLAADVVDDIVKSIGSKFVSGEIKNAPNKNYIYLKLTDIKFGSGVVKMLKSQFGIDAKIDKTFGNIPSVSFASKKVVSESVNEGTTKKDIEKLTSYKDLFKFFKDNKSKLNKKYTNDIEDEIGALKYLESDYKRGDADREEVLIAVEEIQDLIKKSLDIKESVNEAINPEVFREFMQACNDAGLNSFQIFGMHVLVYILTLGATGAAILSALGITQLAKDAKDTFNNWNAGRKLNPQKVKEIVKEFENKVNKLEGGRKRFFQGIINKMKKANPKDKSSLVSINKDLKYYADRYNLDNESINEGKYYIGYNKGRGQGTGVFKDVFPTYKDAKKELEKIEKQRGGSYNQIAYYVVDEKGNFVREAMLGEGRGIKFIQNDLDKTVVAIESEIASYKATKGTPQEKKHIDNLKKLHPIKKKLQSELDMAVSGLYRDAELKIED
jgi:hypothetical protein